ncbi:MAG TPA: ROK family transcriptional regulator [Candidatus Limnocylindrales bacterium]|nr:ROK family transcriptional regulator [Candidatus Limnocylindrales bacterium]
MTMLEKATHQQTRAHNSLLVLRTVYDRSTVSRSDIARITGLTRTSVSDLIGELIDSGLIEEVGRGPSTGGKAPILLRVVPRGREVIGLDLDGEAFSGVRVDLRGTVLHAAERPLDGRDGHDALDLVFSLLDELTEFSPAPLLGIGVGAPGVIDTTTGNVRWAANLDWADLPLGRLLAERYETTVNVGNDSQAAALAEYTFGGTPRPDNLIVVKVGQGIGAGIILGGRLYQGDGFGAGEIGHTTVVEGGEPCRCGSLGCLETVASVRAIVARVRHLAVHHPTSALASDPAHLGEAAVVAAYESGDDVARMVVDDAARQLGRTLAGLVGTLNVRRIRIVGSATAFGTPWLEIVRRETREHALPLLARETEVEFGRTHEQVVALGAGALLLTRELGLSLSR